MKRECGAILPLTAMSVFTFLIVSGVMLTIGLISRERARLRAAVDISLLSAVNTVCPSRECLDRVRATAITTLQANLRSRELDGISPTELDQAGFLRHQWQTEHFTIDIERGRWKPLEGFESIEGDWQLRHPGTPSHSVLYAVRIRVASRINPIFKLLAPDLLSIEANATAIASPVEQRWVAPFALPLCSLLDENGDFDQAKLAHADRFFSSIDRFGATSTNNVVPDFDWSVIPADALANNGVLEDLFGGLRAKYLNQTVKSCEYPTTRFRSATDHYGVVGVPGDIPPDEEFIQELLTGPGWAPAVVGQEFTILPEGLSQGISADLIWSKIANQSVTDAQHRPLSELILDGQPVPANALHFANEPSRSACQDVAQGDKEPLAPFDVRPSHGVCNSRRSGFGNNDWSDFQGRSVSTGPSDITCPYEDNEFASPYWKIQIPVIADESPNAQSCQGVLGSMEDPLLDRSARYSIVGFITIGIYDLDIGQPAPSLAGFPVADSAVRACSGIATQRAIIPESLPQFPFGFRDAAGNARSCNLVRARIDGNVRSLAGSNDAGVSPVLVE